MRESLEVSGTWSRWQLTVLAALAVALASPGPVGAAAPNGDFASWLAAFRTEALESGISAETVEAALADVEPLPRVLELDGSQPRGPHDFCGYVKRRLTPTRIARAKRMLDEHGELLNRLRDEYGVPPRYLVAVWGLETNFGDYMGDYPVVPALATLAYDPRRGGAFRAQLLAALQIIDEGHRRPESFQGSWAGATGQVQFMPTTFLDYAVDYDGDGRKNLWESVPDSLASAANYMQRSGWRPGETWGRRVQVVAHANDDLSGTRPLAEWQSRGVRDSSGSDLPDATVRGSILLPQHRPDPAFLVYRNYRVFLAWNQSTYFAISLGTLADRVTDQGSSPVCGL